MDTTNNFYLFSRISIILGLALLFLPTDSFSQLKIGDWRDHYPYSQTICVTDLGDKIYCATSLAMFSFKKNDNSLEKFSQVQGLSDIDISIIKYSPDFQTLLVTYNNGNIDLVQSSGVTNLSDIFRSTLPGKKNIYDALFIGKLVYLSCDFGIVVLDIDKMEFRDTYFIGENGEPMPVYEIAYLNNRLYAATHSGILSGDINDPLLVDYTHWSRELTLPNAINPFNAIVSMGNNLYANQTGNINSID